MRFRFFLMAVSVFISMPLIIMALDDAHYLQDNDYFVSSEQLKQGYIYVELAKMLVPANVETKNEAHFMKVRSGEEIWTKYYWKTGQAAVAECKIGTLVVCFEGNADDGVYKAPENKDSARNGSWFMAKITDMSDLYKGFFTVSGGYKVHKDNLRIIVK